MMVTKSSRVFLKRKLTDERKARNCRRNFKNILSLIDDFRRPNTNDRKTLREDAERMMIEFKNRRKPILISLKSKAITTRTEPSSSNPSDSNASTSTVLPRVNHTYGGRNFRKVNNYMEVPPEVRAYIKNIQGSDNVIFVTEKALTKTDVTPSQSRLLMPLNQIPRRDDLWMPTGEVRLYVPEKQHHYDLFLTRWDMSKNQNYSLRSGWNDVVRENDLREHMMVQIWSFQVGDKPCLFLVPVDGGCCGGGTETHQR